VIMIARIRRDEARKHDFRTLVLCCDWAGGERGRESEREREREATAAKTVVAGEGRGVQSARGGGGVRSPFHDRADPAGRSQEARLPHPRPLVLLLLYSRYRT